jgi:hypothetical protein
MMGDVVRVASFLFITTGTGIVAAYVLAYAAHSLLVIVQDTAAGIDDVVWPDDPILDWLQQAVFLGILVLVWLAPAGILARALRNTWLEDDPGLRLLLLAVPGLWLTFPVGLLSSLGSESRWTFFKPAVFGRMLRALPHTLVFYAASLALAAAVAASWYYAVSYSGLLLTPVAGLVSAAGILVYARLLGRLARVLQRVKVEKRPKGKAIPRPKEAARVQAHDPWAAPSAKPKKKKKKAKEEDAPPVDLPVAGYGLAGADEPPRAPAPAPKEVDEPSEEEPLPEEEDADAPPRPARRVRTAAEPSWPLFRGVYGFPFYPGSLRALIVLTIGGTILGMGVKGMILFFPGG